MIPNDRNKKGTGFTNLSRILQASKGARLGGQVASGVQNVGQQVRGQIGQASEQFEKKAGEEAARFGEEAARQRAEAISSLVPTSSGSSGINAPQVDQSEAIKNIKNWQSSQYRGPTQLEDYETLAGKVSEAEKLGGLSRTLGGKQELLRRFVGGTDYSQGAQQLDAALLGVTGQPGLSEARRLTRGLGTELAQKSGVASQQAQQLGKLATDFGKDTTTSLLDKKRSVLSGAEYGVGGKSFNELLQEARTKEGIKKTEVDEGSGRKDLMDRIGSFNENFEKLVQAGSKTKDEKRDAFYELLNEAKDQGYISGDEVARLFYTRSIDANDTYDPEYDFISRAQKFKTDPYASLSALLTSGKAPENLNIGGIVAAVSPERASQLSLLEQLAQDPSVEFAKQDAYKQGTLGFEQGTPSFKLQVLDPEVKKFETDLNTAKTNVGKQGKLVGKQLAGPKMEIIDFKLGRSGGRDQIFNMIKKGLPIDVNQIKGYNKLSGDQKRDLRAILIDYNKSVNYRDILNTNTTKAKEYQTKLKQEQAAIDNPYASQSNIVESDETE